MPTRPTDHDALKRTPMGRKVKELTWEHHDWSHVRLAQATYDDTLAVHSEYEGVLLQLKEDLEEQGFYLYHDTAHEAIMDDEDGGFYLIFATHDHHPNYF